ncbi:hypothetical protein HJG60_011383 [Phyllostomus discolor]|uniref:Uncharacterized protein n=1 Tax=Phyllostomus discolor TaxID=89673 RepID=A0A834A460_9CHIR|nr:hypothetical protein HJG60_011383 [Phyllostomus discolor]
MIFLHMVLKICVFVCVPENCLNIPGISRNYFIGGLGREGNEFFPIDTIILIEGAKRMSRSRKIGARAWRQESASYVGMEHVNLTLEQRSCWEVVGHRLTEKVRNNSCRVLNRRVRNLYLKWEVRGITKFLSKGVTESELHFTKTNLLGCLKWVTVGILI